MWTRLQELATFWSSLWIWDDQLQINNELTCWWYYWPEADAELSYVILHMKFITVVDHALFSG